MTTRTAAHELAELLTTNDLIATVARFLRDKHPGWRDEPNTTDVEVVLVDELHARLRDDL